jgi:ATP-dependent Clp protease ATP-binding subunit ClpA
VTMFDRFNDAARSVVVHGQEEARTLGHSWIGTEHLLLGVLAESDNPAVNTLIELGVNLEGCRVALGRLVGRGRLDVSDAAALRTLGIDLEQVRSQVEAAFGPGALDQPPRITRRRKFRRRRRCEGPPGSLAFMPRAKRALERSSQEAANLGDRQVGVEHLLLGLLDPKGNMAVELLQQLDADAELVRGRVLRALGKAA